MNECSTQLKKNDFAATSEIYGHLLEGGCIIQNHSGVKVKLIDGNVHRFYTDGQVPHKAGHLSFENFSHWSEFVQPKPKVKLYKFAYKLTDDNNFVESNRFYSDENECRSQFSSSNRSAVKLFRVDGSMIEVEAE